MILVVNADDAGVDGPRNRGILRGVRQGVVRSASLLVGGKEAREFAREAMMIPSLGVGLHLNLTEGSPRGRNAGSLVDENGRFFSKQDLWTRAIEGRLDRSEVLEEVSAQWESLKALGIRPTHLDGHNHVHLFPTVAEALLEVLPAGTWVRCPSAPQGADPHDETLEGCGPEDPYESRGACLRTLRRLAARALSLGWTLFRRADVFVGPELPLHWSADDLLRLLSRGSFAGARVLELMTHPGERCEGSVPYSSSPDREKETEALIDPRILRLIEERGIRLAHFGEIP